MNFFEQQERAKRNTGKLVMLMVLAVVSLIVISSVAVAAILALLSQNDPNSPLAAGDWFAQTAALLDWNLVGTIAVLMIGVALAGSLFKHFQLRSGGKAVAESLDGRPIDPATTDLEERKILNVVEEMAIASGIAVPPVYVMDDDSINAFAAGHTPQDAVIGVTWGCIRLLTREELQGVIAHEFSHIFHGDMRLNTTLVATLNGILLIGLIGYILLRSAPFRRSNSKDNSVFIMVAIGVVLVVVGFAGTFFGNLIKSAVSRQREFLADASSVQYTRNPAGIANALKKIGGYDAGSRVQAANASEYSHMFFSLAVGGAFSTFMATHPPLTQRIRRIEPDWDGNFISPQLDSSEASGPGVEPRAGDDRSRAVLGMLGAAAVGTLTGSQSPAQATSLGAKASQDAIDAIGQPSTRHVAYAQQAIAALDPELRAATHDAYSARALIYGLLMAATEPLRSSQLTVLQQSTDPDVYRYVTRLAPKLATLDPRLRLPLVALALPALKQLSSTQYNTFKDCLGGLIMADKQVSLMEWALYRIVVHNIEPSPRSPQRTALARLRNECQVLLSVLIHAGNMNDAEAHIAFSTAASSLPFERLELLPRNAVSAAALEPAVIYLSTVAPSDKHTLIQALAQAVEHDGVITVAEAELLRAIADSLGCPLPPLLAGEELNQSRL
jgi:Zn-dependent protease with chaperone function